MSLNLSLILLFSLSLFVPNRILLRYPLRVSEFSYAMVRKRTKMSKNVGVYLSRRGVHFYLGRASLRW